jgi:hypothetical protein
MIPPHIEQAQRAYAECVQQKQNEMLRYGQATQVRDLIDHRERYAEALRMNPQMAKQYAGGVDQVIDEAFKRYRAAGGTASTPQAVQPGEPPCAPPVTVPPGPRAARVLQPAPAALREAELRLENCVVRNRPAHDLWQASVRVAIAVERRDELRKVGERMNWGASTRENFQRSERDVAEQFARYVSLGGAARAAEEVTRGTEPCREERMQLDAAVRTAYPSEPSPITQSRTLQVPSGSVPVPPPKAAPK